MSAVGAVAEIVDLLGRRRDAVAVGEPAHTGPALAEAARRLPDDVHVVEVEAPAGGLSLSGLIALLSDQPDFDGHDDSALEVALRRLSAQADGADTVLLLHSTAGLSRSAFRFLRQLARLLPQLRFLMVAFDGMDALLAEPGMDELRERLGDAARVQVAGPPPAPALAEPVPAVLPMVPAVLRPVRARRPGLLPVASAMGMAASLALGAWLGTRWVQPAPAVQAGVDKQPISVQSASAIAPTPAPAHAAVPDVAGAPPPSLAEAGTPQIAGPVPAKTAALPPMVPVPARPPALAPRAAPEHALAAILPEAEPAATEPASGRPARIATEERRRPPARPPQTAIARTEPPHYFWMDRRPGARWTEPESGEPDGPQPAASGRAYGFQAYRSAPPEWRGERAVGPEPGTYIGTYAAGPYGSRVFTYQP